MDKKLYKAPAHSRLLQRMRIGLGTAGIADWTLYDVQIIFSYRQGHGVTTLKSLCAKYILDHARDYTDTTLDRVLPTDLIEFLQSDVEKRQCILCQTTCIPLYVDQSAKYAFTPCMAALRQGCKGALYPLDTWYTRLGPFCSLDCSNAWISFQADVRISLRTFTPQLEQMARWTCSGDADAIASNPWFNLELFDAPYYHAHTQPRYYLPE